jgi:hypothetical protein
MQIKELIKKLKEYPDNYFVTINDPNPKTEGSRKIWYVEEDMSDSSDDKRYVDIVMRKDE